MHNSPWFTLSRHDEGETETTETSAEGGKTEPIFQAIKTQEQLDAVIGTRLKAQRSQFADYEDLKAKAAKLAEIEAATQSEAEKANARAEAAEKAQAETARKSAERIATAELKAALTGLVDDIAAEIDDLNLAKFIGEDGEVDPEAIARLKARKVAEFNKKPKAPGGDLDPGSRDDHKPVDFRTADKATTKAALAAIGVNSY